MMNEEKREKNNGRRSGKKVKTLKKRTGEKEIKKLEK